MAETLCTDCIDKDEVLGTGAHCDSCNKCLDCDEVHEERDWYAQRPTEATLIRKVYKALKAAGTPIVKGYDLEEWVTFETQKDVLNFAFNLDEFGLYTESGAMVWFIMGQGAEGLVDYSMSLEPVFQESGLLAWIDKKMD